MRDAPGFTLIEVLIAFAILTTALTLVAVQFSRHLAALQILEGSIGADHLADWQLMREALRRELKVDALDEEKPNSSSGSPSTSSVSFRPYRFDQPPVKDLVVDQATSEVPWQFRRQDRSTQIVSVFEPQSTP